jgi:hypothetical protein
MEPTYEQLKAVADAVEYETQNNGDWFPLVKAMVAAGYKCVNKFDVPS